MPSILRIIVLSISVILFNLSTSTQSKVPSPQKFALVIGIRGYPKFREEEKLQFSDRDAEKFAEFIQMPEGGAFTKDSIKILTNSDATRENIFRAINWLGKRVSGNDLVYVFFSGHGVVDDRGQAYFMPYDADPNYPDALGIRADLLFQDLKAKLDSKHMIYFIDACHSGAALTVSGVARGSSSSISTEISKLWEKELAEREAISIAFVSASSNQRSWEDNELRQGIFTFYLLEGMRGGADRNKDGKVTAGEVHRYVLDKVEEHSTKKYSIQTPIISPSFDHNFPLSIIYPHSSIIRPDEQPKPNALPAYSAKVAENRRILSRGVPKAVINSFAESEIINYVILTSGEGWAVIKGRNGYVTNNIPDSLRSALNEANRMNEEISRIAVYGNDQWIIIKGTNGYHTQNIPQDMLNALKEANTKKNVITDVAFSPKGGWMVISDKTVTWGGEIPQELAKAIRETRDLRRVAFSPDGGWVLIKKHNEYWTNNVPQDIVIQLLDINKRGEAIQEISFTPDGGWIIIVSDEKTHQ